MRLKKLNHALMLAGLISGGSLIASLPAQAVMMSDDGTGEVLLYPFYTVQGPTDSPRSTLLTVVNHANEYKAVKVRFHEAHNSRDALDFNLYLSPQDEWTATITRNNNGVAQLTTTDKSCTLPKEIMTTAYQFSTAAFTQEKYNDGGNQDALRTNEGYVEVIEMGVINPNITLLTTDTAADNTGGPISGAAGIDTFGEAILHSNGIPGGSMSSNYPVGCLALEQAAINASGRWTIADVTNTPAQLDNAHNAISQPRGGLSGAAYILQNGKSTVMAYNADALKHFYDVDGFEDTGTTANTLEANDICSNLNPTPFNAVGRTGALCETGGTAIFTSLATAPVSNAFTAVGAATDADLNADGTAAEGAVAINTLTTQRAFDDIHNFKDLLTATANPRSVQTYPNLTQAFPQISTHLVPTNRGGRLIVAEWATNELVSTGINRSSQTIGDAAIRDLAPNGDINKDGVASEVTPLTTGGGGGAALGISGALTATVGGVSSTCGGLNGVQSAAAIEKSICSNARPITAVLMRERLMNEYVLEQAGGLDFRTDVIVTMPTKWYFSDNGVFDVNNVDSDASTTVFWNLDSAAAPVPTKAQATLSIATLGLAPFTSQFVNSSNRDRACENFNFKVYNREEGAVGSAPGVLVPSPAITQTTQTNAFCHEANVITFNNGDLMTSRIANGIGATVANSASGQNAFNLNTGTFLSGWFIADLNTTGHAMTSLGTMFTWAAAPLNNHGTLQGAMALGHALTPAFFQTPPVAPLVSMHPANYFVGFNDPMGIYTWGSTVPTGGGVPSPTAPATGAITDGITIRGLPIVGFVAEGLINPQGGTFLGNFTAAFPHKYVHTFSKLNTDTQLYGADGAGTGTGGAGVAPVAPAGINGFESTGYTIPTIP